MRHSAKITNPKIGVALVAFSLVAGLAFQTLAASASPSSELKHMFRQIDRQLCRSFNATGCKHAKRKTSPAPSNSEPAAPKPATPAAASPAAKVLEPKAAPVIAIPAPKASETKPAKKEASLTPPSAPDIQTHGKIDIGTSPAIPMPRLRPQHLGEQEKPAPQPPSKIEQAAIPKVSPVPIPVPSPVPPTVEPPVLPPTPHPMPDNTLFGEACFSELQKLGVKFDRVATPVSSGACSVSDAVKVSGVMRDADLIKFPDVPTLNCGFALRFSSWVKEQAAPIVQTRLSTKITTIGTGPGYQCRGRNGDSSAKLSEHAFGNAVDIERMKLADGEVVEVLNAIDTSNKFQPMLADLRAAGCQSFMTVLGPGANSAHASHFHFDLERRGKKGDNRMCQ